MQLSRRDECYLVEVAHGWMHSDGGKRFTRNKYVPKWLIKNVVTTWSNSGIYMTAYAYNTADIENAILYGDFYLDFDINDIQNAFEKIRKDALHSIIYLENKFKINREDIRIYFSGKKGVHLIIPKECFDFEPHEKLNVIFKEMAVNIKAFTPNKTVDTAIYDNKRVFRYPGSVHEGTGLHKISLTFDELRKSTIDEIYELAKMPRVLDYKEPKVSQSAKKEFEKIAIDTITKLNKPILAGGQLGVLRTTPPCIKYLIDNGAAEGNRNNSLAVLVSYYKRTGLSFDQVLQEIEKWNDSLVSGMPKHELKGTTKSVYQSDKIFGCTALKEISQCNVKECQLKRKG